VAAGLRGTMLDNKFDWDLTLSHSRYYSDSHQPQFLTDKLLGYFFTDSGFDFNRYFSPLSPEVFQSLIGDASVEGRSQVTQAQFSLSGDLFELPAGPVGVAAVLETASQKYSLRPDERLLPGYQGDDSFWNLTATGGGGSRDRYAFGVETSIPVFSTLTASLAARFDKYDDVTAVDNAFTWNAGLEWRPVSNLLLRANHATSFRAPDMHWVFADESGFFTSIFDEYRFRRDGYDPNDNSEATNAARADYVYQVFGTRRGDPGLREEEGTSTTAGIVWDVSDDLAVTLDWYRIRLDGSVADLRGYLFREEAACLLGTDRNGNTVDGNSSACQLYTNQIARDPGDDETVAEFATYPINQAMIETSGVDASITYGLDTDRMGDFRFRLSWSHVLENRDQLFDDEPIRELRDNKQFFNFRSRMNWQMGWEKNSWSANLYGYRWGSLPNWAETSRIAPFIVWNASMSKKFNDKFTVSVLVNNLFDNHHPKDNTFNSYPFFWGAYDAVGREAFVQLDYKF
jgi:outer membrane receptor protein involved in Fe transport